MYTANTYTNPPTYQASQAPSEGEHWWGFGLKQSTTAALTHKVWLQQMEDSEMEEEEDSQADGFVVDDGYLSEGEGGPMDADEFGAGLEGNLSSSVSPWCPQQHGVNMLMEVLTVLVLPACISLKHY